MCERAIETLRSLNSSKSFNLTILNIEEDSELFDRYWIKVPVIRFNGVDVLEAEDIVFPSDCKAKLEKFLDS